MRFNATLGQLQYVNFSTAYFSFFSALDLLAVRSAFGSIKKLRCSTGLTPHQARKPSRVVVEARKHWRKVFHAVVLAQDFAQH